MAYFDQLGQVVTVLGTQWGDEGKGKLTDILAEKYNVIARATGGSNAGHTIKVDGQKYVFHLLPSGVLYPKNICVIGNGCVIHFPTLLKELENLAKYNMNVTGRLFVSDQAHIVFDYHQEIDGQQEEQKGGAQVGTTKRGIGPAYTDKMSRIGIRVGDLLFPDQFTAKLKANIAHHRRMYNLDVDFETEAKFYLEELLPQLKPFITDTVGLLETYYKEGRKILLEGANGTHLDIDHGTYPYVTSSSPTIGGICTGTGIGAHYLNDIVGIVKAYTTRVGAGPFVTELEDETGEKIREIGGEFGSTTGRPRRCGWLDLVILRRTIWLNSLTEINLTKLDVLSGLENLNIAVAYDYRGTKLLEPPSDLDILAECKPVYKVMPGFSEDITKCRTFEELPEAARNYVQFIQDELGIPAKTIGVGQGRDEMVWV